MKHTIVTKIKRFALTLFAALCVGSVWAGYLSFDVDKFTMSEDGTITFDAVLGYHGTTTERFAQLTATGYNEDGSLDAFLRRTAGNGIETQQGDEQ